jgi:hypothetical protein
MDTHEKSQSQGSGGTGTETTIAVADIDRVFDALESLYTVETQRAAEAAVETLGRMLSTGTFALEDISALTELEELLDEVPNRLEAVREEVAELRARL